MSEVSIYMLSSITLTFGLFDLLFLVWTSFSITSFFLIVFKGSWKGDFMPYNESVTAGWLLFWFLWLLFAVGYISVKISRYFS